MLHPVYAPFAFMGGRSWAEIATCDQTKAMDSSIAIGVANTLSAVIIFFGQMLFWSSIPSTAALALPIALVLMWVYSLFYRMIVRAIEVANIFGKAMLATAAFCLAGVNALLAGHELVLIPFAPQVEAMSLSLAGQSVTDFRDTTEKTYGLQGLRGDAQQARNDEDQARARLNTVPQSIQVQQQQAQTCDRQALLLRAGLPESTSMGYEAAVSAWREQRRRCAALTATARKELLEYQAQARKDLSAAAQHRANAESQLTQAQGQSDSKISQAEPALTASATTGFGRHEALWAAVNAGKVPAYSAYGLMLLALVLESFGLLLKIFLPTDEATYTRVGEARITSAIGESELAYTRAFRLQIKPAIKAQVPQMQSAAERLVASNLGPSMVARFTADLFARAAVSTRNAQRRSQQAATPVIDELAKVMPA